MTAPVAMTYDSLVALLPSYCEFATDAATAFEEHIPTFISLAENRIATDMKQLGFQSVVNNVFTASGPGAVIAKPAWWRETISFSYLDPVAGWVPIKMRALEYVRTYWPIQGTLGAPRFYADYNFNNFLVAPSPNTAYPFQLVYYARLNPLSDSNQVNWLTVNAPQVLLAASILEAQLWAKDDKETQRWQTQYQMALQGFNNETKERLNDRTEVVTRG